MERLFAAGTATIQQSNNNSDPFAGLLPWELTDEPGLRVPVADDGALQLEFGAALFEFTGLCHFADALPPHLLQACLAAAEAHTSTTRKSVEALGIAPDGPRGFRFHEACQRGPGRVDMRLGASPPVPFDDARLVGAEAKWAPLVREILGADCRLLHVGLVVTEPGVSTEQALHCDGPHVAAEWRRHEPEVAARARQEQHPCHCLTVFLPLVDLTVANGATTFFPGTHHSAIAASALSREAEDPGSSGGAGRPARLLLPAGDAILFDYRLFHAGGANRSHARRPLLCLVYARPWFEDTFNFGTIRLSDVQVSSGDEVDTGICKQSK